MKSNSIIQILFLTTILLGCATGYSESNFTGGYSGRRLTRNEFTVNFSGNGYTSSQRASDLCLLRCSEITLEYGFNYFAFKDSKNTVDNSTTFTTGSVIPTGSGGGLLLATSQTIPKPQAENTIICFRSRPTSMQGVLDARDLFDTLSKKYSLKPKIETNSQFKLSKKLIGVILSQQPQDKNQFVISGFLDNSKAQHSGLKIGDRIVAADGIAWQLYNTTNLGSIVELTVQRSNKKLKIPVETSFIDQLGFKKISDLKITDQIPEDKVTVIEGSLNRVTAFCIEEFIAHENPVTSLDEFKAYAIAAAANKGANCVRLLTSNRTIKDSFPKADDHLGFYCSLLLLPKSHLGLDFETGDGYEGKYVIRRIHNHDAELAGLRIGDKILAFEGIDVVQDSRRAKEEQMRWDVGRTVELIVARDGKEIKIPVKTIPNKKPDSK